MITIEYIEQVLKQYGIEPTTANVSWVISEIPHHLHNFFGPQITVQDAITNIIKAMQQPKKVYYA